MKKLTSTLLFAMIILTSNGWAVETTEDQQAMLYYQIPFGGVKKQDNAHKFGFRVDSVTIDSSTGQYSDARTFSDIMKKPASLDFQMGHDGMTAFKMHGYDYLPYLISKADEGEAEVGTEVETDTETTGETEVKKEKELPAFSDVIFEQTNFGIILGVGIAVIALAGAGG